jgi:hypothetical protein
MDGMKEKARKLHIPQQGGRGFLGKAATDS